MDVKVRLIDLKKDGEVQLIEYDLKEKYLNYSLNCLINEYTEELIID